MNAEPTATSKPAPRRILGKTIVLFAAGLLLVYLALAYLLAPTIWRHYARQHPAFENMPGVTHTKSGIPGDPLNVALVGSAAELQQAMEGANWRVADALGLRSDLKISADSVLGRPDPTAPVSSLYLWGRRQDLAFEQEVGNTPRHRHHVRFWKTEKVHEDGRPIWIGSAVYDERVGLSRTTGQVTHVTAPDVDTERDFLLACLLQSGELSEHFAIDDFHNVRAGTNGGGDPWRTDGKLAVGVIKPPPEPASSRAE